jgi:hypothetical protein
MRRRVLALLLALSTPALAQQPAQPPPVPPAPQVAPPADKAEKLTPEQEDRIHVRAMARYLFQNLILGDARTVCGELIYPFQLEDKRYGLADELVAAWVKELRVKRTDLVTLYDVEVLNMAEMERKYGKPPARLGLNLTGIQAYAAVGNLSGRAAIFLFRETPDGWRAFAYTD